MQKGEKEAADACIFLQSKTKINAELRVGETETSLKGTYNPRRCQCNKKRRLDRGRGGREGGTRFGK